MRCWVTAWAFVSALLGAAAGCTSDPCAAYAGQGCIVLEVRAGTSGVTSVDQLRVGSPALLISEQSTPSSPLLASLPVQVPVLAGTFAGTYSISVQAVKGGATIGVGTLSGGSLRVGEHRFVAIDLAAPTVSSDFAVVQALPVGETLTTIWGSDASHVYAAGSNGLRMDYYQGSWHRAQSHLGWDYNQVWGTSATDVYSVATVVSDGSGVVEHFDGTAWRTVYTPKAPLMGVWGPGPEVVYAVAADGMIHARGPNGVWGERLSKPLAASAFARPGDPVLWSICGTGQDDFAMAAGVDRIFHYVGSGDFVNLDPDQDRTVEFRTTWSAPGPDTSVFFGGNYFGTYWLTSHPPPGATAVGEQLYRIGVDQRQSGAESVFVQGIWGIDTHVLFVGDGGRISHLDLGTNVMSSLPSPTQTRLFAAWGASAQDVWIVGERELIMHGALR